MSLSTLPKVPHKKKLRNILALQNALKQVPWGQLHHTSGPTTDTPVELLQVYGLPTAKGQLAQLLGE